MEAGKVCRFCQNSLTEPFLDLGVTPLANSYVTDPEANGKEPRFPLRVYFCGVCHLVQLADFYDADQIFKDDYAYFSSFSESWLKHARDYVEKVTQRFRLGYESHVVELASNDGYLLQYFVQRGIPVLGVEPAKNCAEAAMAKKIPCVVKFFGADTAFELVQQGKAADLLIGNNVLAHVPNLNDFVKGMKLILKPGGVLTMEFPHLLKLIEEVQFDTIYHEHFSYFSFSVVKKVFKKHGIDLFDVEELPTHGGSLRIYGRHEGVFEPAVTDAVRKLEEKEEKAGLDRIETYELFAEKVKGISKKLNEFLQEAKTHDKMVAGYGAPAKGNTLLNYCGVGSDLIPFTVDVSPHKQSTYLPGSHLPVYPPSKIFETQPDYVLILPWNIKDEIMHQMSEVRQWGGRFVVPIPEPRVLN